MSEHWAYSRYISCYIGMSLRVPTESEAGRFWLSLISGFLWLHCSASGLRPIIRPRPPAVPRSGPRFSPEVLFGGALQALVLLIGLVTWALAGRNAADQASHDLVKLEALLSDWWFRTFGDARQRTPAVNSQRVPAPCFGEHLY